MTLTKSLLLGSAATLVVVAGAQAADLPTKKGAPAAEYVKVCKVGDIAGFVIPGSDTCLKISGYVNAQIAMGNVANEYTLAPVPYPLPVFESKVEPLAPYVAAELSPESPCSSM